MFFISFSFTALFLMASQGLVTLTCCCEISLFYLQSHPNIFAAVTLPIGLTIVKALESMNLKIMFRDFVLTSFLRLGKSIAIR